MWAIRRASANYLNFRSSFLSIAALRASTGVGPVSNHKEDMSSASERHLVTADRLITSKACKCTVCNPKQFSTKCRYLSSQAGANSGGEEEDDDLDETLESGLLEDPEEDVVEEALKKKYEHSVLFKLLLEEHAQSTPGALDKYFEDKELSRPEVCWALGKLRKRKLFGRHFGGIFFVSQLSEWLEKREDFEFSVGDYASMLDLIAKLRGLSKAETYLDSVPESFKEEVVYRSLLANYVSKTLVNKAEELFNKMKHLGVPITVFTCNQMLLLYKKANKRKMGNMLLMMEKENIKPSLFTYEILIDAKGKLGDIKGMEQVVETMKASDIEPNVQIQSVLAKHYASSGHKEKAQLALKEIEGNNLKNIRFICPVLLSVHAILGNSEEVKRIWKITEPKPGRADVIAAIEAFGKLKNIEMAESIFEKLTKTTTHYNTMLKVYADNKMVAKGKALVKQMEDARVNIGPFAWDSLVKLYVVVEKVDKADKFLQKVVSQNPRVKPTFNSYMTILHHYSRRGDVHNAEKTFQSMRIAGYVTRVPFHVLIQTYINAKVPAYGIRERMKADNVFPNKGLATKLALLDACIRNSVSELLE